MSLSNNVKRFLWTKSAGYCQNPSCNIELYQFFQNKFITNIEELAHIIPKSDKGPRKDDIALITDRDSYENIIILCPNCHTKIDKAPKLYPRKTLLKWKIEHENNISKIFKIPTYESRKILSEEIRKLILQNKSIFDEYGPHSEHSKEAISDASNMWHIKSIETIIPNNKRILEITKKNIQYFNEEEKSVIEKFAIHIEGFEYNKLSNDKISTVPKYPIKINKIFNL